MHIILRKIGGTFDALWHGSGRPAGRTATLTAFVPAGLLAFLFSPAVLALLIVAFAAAYSFANPSQVADGSLIGFGLAGVAGSIRELQDKRAALVAEARSITEKAATEKRVALHADEESRYNAIMTDVDAHGKAIEREQRQAELERSIASNTPAAPVNAGTPESRANPRGTEEYRNAFSAFLSKGERGMTPDERRALSVGTDTAGGFTTVSEQFVDGLIKNVDNLVVIRGLATKRSVPTAVSLGVMTLDADPDDADWTSELATGSEDSTMAFGRRKMIPHPMAKRLKVSKDFLRQTLSGGEALVRERLAYKFGITQEKGFMTGTGVQQPLGVFTASADGIPTSRDVSTGNTTTAITFDGLIEAKYSLKAQYMASAALRWIFHRDALKSLAKIKDGEGQYIWRPSIVASEPDRLLNVGIVMSEYAPNTFTTGLYVGLLGDFSNYWIADAYDLAIQRLDELYAETNQVGFIGRLACDGQPVLSEAFARVKLT